MEENRLISISEHSDWLDNKGELNNYEKWYFHRKRVGFGKQPLELWMFVPCKLVEDVWVVLEEPLLSVDFWEKGDVSKELQEYQQAKEKCLFFSQHGNEEMFDQCLAKVFLDEFFNIEQLANEIRNIILTPTALKQIGL